MIASLWLDGTDTKLEGGDPLLFVFGEKPDQQVLRWVKNVQADFDAKRTKVVLQSKGGTVAYAGLEAALGRLVEDSLANDQPIRMSASPVAQEAVSRLEAIQNAIGLGVEPQVLAEIAVETAARLGTLAARPAVPRAVRDALNDLAKGLNDVVKAPKEEAVLAGVGGVAAFDAISAVFGPLATKASVPPASRARLARDASSVFTPGTDVAPRLITTLRPELRDSLYPAWESRAKNPPAPLKVFALRVRASLFGHNAPERLLEVMDGRVIASRAPRVFDSDGEGGFVRYESPDRVDLDGSYDKILKGTWVVIDTPATHLTSGKRIVAKTGSVDTPLSRAAYGLSGKVTRIALGFLDDPGGWIKLDDKTLKELEPEYEKSPMFDLREIRETRVLAQSEELTLAEAPIAAPICGDEIELGAVYDELEPGRWLIVTGERADVPGVTGLRDGELAMLGAVRQDLDPLVPGDRLHTTLTLAAGGLAHCYRRDTVAVFGNVVKGTHGETRLQVLGGGDGGRPFQRFDLQASPLTYLPAPTPTGAESTLAVRVTEVLWHETGRLPDAAAADRIYVTKTDDDDKTSVTFGDGVHGARLPTGRENIKAVYRTGIGKPGNAKAGQISLLNTRPLGVKSVVNPLRASGGADRDSRDQARANLTIALRALGRLVSVQDYADFTRSFAGIGKASAVRLTDGARQVIHVTIAGVDDIPIDPASDLHQKLLQALVQLGDPYQPIRLAARELELLVIGAGIRVEADYEWDAVEPRLRAALLQTFGFQSREIGQDVPASEVLAAMQGVDGVAYADLDTFGAVSAADSANPQERLNQIAIDPPADRVAAALARPDRNTPGVILPAQLALLTPDVPDTLLLKELRP